MNNIHNINGSIMQLALNERGETRNTYGSRNIYTNVAVDFQTYNFENYKLTLSRNVDKVLPEYLILNLYDNTTTLETIYNCGRNIYINFKIGAQTLLNIPLSILWNLKEPEICDNKLYLKIPFAMFFGDIYIAGLQFREVTFTLVNHTNLVNYVSDYSLLCKTYIGDSQYRRNSLDTSSCCIQQISSLELHVSLENHEDTSDEFKIQTNSFQGFSKGFFIETNNINELNNMRFYINDLIRIDYNRFMIRNKSQRINDNMIFLPFNADIVFNERSFNSFVGSINLSEVIQSTLKLIFDTPRNKVKVYSMNMNDYVQTRSEITSSQNTINTHLVEDFTRHSLMHVERRETSNIVNNIVNDISVNSIIENHVPLNLNLILENEITVNFNNLYSGISDTNYNNYYINNSVDTLIIDAEICRLIPEERKTCGINLEEINVDQKYMSCAECSNNFNEISIRIWLTQRRTCPSCRCNWSDFNVYSNA
jgi:hypothetical protein